jgi:hypothetical protein
VQEAEEAKESKDNSQEAKEAEESKDNSQEAKEAEESKDNCWQKVAPCERRTTCGQPVSAAASLLLPSPVTCKTFLEMAGDDHYWPLRGRDIYCAPDILDIYYAAGILEQMPSLADPSRGAQRAVEKGAEGGLETACCRQLSRPS